MSSNAHSWRHVQERDRAWERINAAMREIDPHGDAAVAMTEALARLNQLVTHEEHVTLWETLGDALTEIADARRGGPAPHASWRRP